MVVVSLGWKGDTIATGVAAEGEVVTLGDGERSIAPLSTEVLGAASLHVADVKGGSTWLVNPGTVAGLAAPATWVLADLAEMRFEVHTIPL